MCLPGMANQTEVTLMRALRDISEGVRALGSFEGNQGQCYRRGGNILERCLKLRDGYKGLCLMRWRRLRTGRTLRRQGAAFCGQT
jgi:hypothetical protein